MQTHSPDPSTHPVCTATSHPLAVTFCVRADVSAACRRQIEAVHGRLRALEETPLVAETRLRQWPPHDPSSDAGAMSGPTREDLVSEFEQWADRHGYSLAPAVRRHRTPSALASSEGATTEVRVPTMLLALRDADADPAPIRGVVPYTTAAGTEEPTTYVVPDWLRAAEEAAGLSGRTRHGRPTDPPVGR
jgi:hypothetical protein